MCELGVFLLRGGTVSRTLGVCSAKPAKQSARLTIRTILVSCKLLVRPSLSNNRFETTN